MRKSALAALSVGALASAAPATADLNPGHDAKVKTQTPPVLCEIGSDDGTPAIVPNVVCQGKFCAGSRRRRSGLRHRVGPIHLPNRQYRLRPPPFDTLFAGQTHHIQGWTIVAGGDGIRFTHDGSGHGMYVDSDTTVDPF